MTIILENLFTSIIIVIVITIVIIRLSSRNTKEQKSQDDFPNDARAQKKQAEKEYRKQWYGIAISHLSESDDEYALISNKENIYKLPVASDYSSYQEPLIDNERIKKFVEWAKNIKSTSFNSNLFDLMDHNCEIIAPEPTINGSFELLTDGGFFCEDFDAYGFEINRFNSTFNFEFDNKTWVNLLTEPNLFDWLNLVRRYDYIWDPDDEAGGYFTYYLKDNGAEFIPMKGDVWDYWDAESQGANISEPVNIEVIDEISYEDKIFMINEEDFMFSKKEKDHLITLLMASYKPSLMFKIIEEGNNLSKT